MSQQERQDDGGIYLQPTAFIESDAEAIQRLAGELRRPTARETAVALFNWVRDSIRYDPYTALDPAPSFRATAVLERGRGFCVQKAVLLAALARAAGIPARLSFVDVRNHKSPPKMREMMGTDLFVYHGFVELEIDGRWVKATPAFDQGTSQKAGVLPVELDGDNDAMLHPVDPQGHPFIEYVRDRGAAADLPFDGMRRAFVEAYGEHWDEMGGGGGERE